jgi:ornithine carbamoyltransferase
MTAASIGAAKGGGYARYLESKTIQPERGDQLADYAQVLRQQGGGVTKAWKPGAPPAEWAGE